MKDTPIDFNIVKQKIKESKLKSVGDASIREIKKLVDQIERASGEKFVRMEMGIPGLPPTQIGVEAQKAALDRGVAAIYPDIFGIPELKFEMSKFIKNFMNVDVDPEGCLPTVGSMQGSFAAFLTLNRMYKDREGTLFLDPGFPVHKQQLRVMGQEWDCFDVYNYRGEKLRAKLESYLSTGRFCSLLYSNPNNPSWICFTDKELQIIGELATKYNIIVIEDLAYFAMDFRKDYSVPGKPPYQPTVAHYTNNWVLLISSSKAFSYAGERVGMMVISDKLFDTTAPDLLRFYRSDNVGYAMIFGSIYSLSSGTPHSAQHALAAILKAVNEGRLDFRKEVMEYGHKAKIMKKIFLDNGFTIVYDKDEDEPIADGFYFTFAYPGLSGAELLEKFLYYGISAITLDITGSDRSEGIRACVSLVKREQFGDLEERLRRFNEDHK
jgi:aspartate/methionine/tyrosine aminotransferase